MFICCRTSQSLLSGEPALEIEKKGWQRAEGRWGTAFLNVHDRRLCGLLIRGMHSCELRLPGVVIPGLLEGGRGDVVMGRAQSLFLGMLGR